jgi:nucleotide-binding universal stress UspA family protein
MDHAEDALRAQLKSESDTYNQIDVAVAIGDPGHEIADFASNVGADIIVLPCHGRTGLKRLLIGSVAERVVRLAHCPVLVLKD